MKHAAWKGDIIDHRASHLRSLCSVSGYLKSVRVHHADSQTELGVFASPAYRRILLGKHPWKQGVNSDSDQLQCEGEKTLAISARDWL